MNTVPSGNDDFCMKGASAVYGTTSVGMPAPAMVGTSLKWKMEVVAEPEEAADEALVIVAEEPAVVLPLVFPLVLAAVVLAAAVDPPVVAEDAVVFDAVAVERSVTSVNCALIGAHARARRRTAAAKALVCMCDFILYDTRLFLVNLNIEQMRRLANVYS